MPKKVFRAIYAVNYCIQAGFCMVCPAGLIILGGWLLRTRCGLGRWIMIAAIVFGVFAGLYSMFHFLLTPPFPRLPMFRHLTKRRMIRMEPVNESTSGSLKWLVLPTLAAEVVLSGIMLGCYALFAALRQDILLGAALGTAAALVNFAAMILGLLRASKKENPLSAQLTSRVLFVVRMVVLLVVLVIALKSKRFDPLATLLPLCFMRLALMASELVRKKKKGVPAA